MAGLNDNEEEDEEGNILVVTRVMMGAFTAVLVLVVHKLGHRVFRAGNRAAARKRERLKKAGWVSRTSRASTIADAPAAAAPWPPLPRLTWKEQLRMRAHEASRGSLAAWVINRTVFYVLLWMFTAFGATYGEEDTYEMLTEWGISMGAAWFVLEPFQILLIVIFTVCLTSGKGRKCADKMTICFDLCG